MILHIVNKNLRAGSVFSDCLRQCAGGDAILLIEDGTLAALDTPINRDWLMHCPADVELYALQEDLQARGVDTHVLAAVKTVDYAGFVKLVEKFSLSQTWF